MKFFHISNVNLGNPEEFSLPIDRKKEYSEDFRKIIRNCNEEKADLLFITGNLFAHVPSEAELKEADALFAALEGTRVFLLTGENDAPEKPEEALSYKWSSNVTVFAGDCIQRVYLSALNLEITGAGYAKSTWGKVRPETLSRGKKGAIQILLLPFIESASDNTVLSNVNYPFDYVGLGQTHYFKSGEGKTIYAPGSFEPEDFSGQLKHGCFAGTINVREKNHTTLDLRFLKTAGREYLTLQVNGEKDIDYSEVESRVREIISQQGEKNIYRIILKGEASPSLYFMKNDLYRAGNVLEVLDETSEDDMLRSLSESHAGDAVGRFLTKLQPDVDEEIRKKAIRYGIDALLFGQEERNDG